GGAAFARGGAGYQRRPAMRHPNTAIPAATSTARHRCPRWSPWWPCRSCPEDSEDPEGSKNSEAPEDPEDPVSPETPDAPGSTGSPDCGSGDGGAWCEPNAWTCWSPW